MMNVGIKNAILLLLIILILHFLLMNIIADHQQTRSLPNTTSPPLAQPSKEIEKGKESKKETFECEKTKQDDLLAYVMQEEGGFGGLQADWVDSNDYKFDKELPVVCDTSKLLESDQNLPQMKPKVSSKETTTRGNINNNFLVIQEYENESGLNGGKVFDGLCGFDEYGDSFQTL